MNKKLKIKKIFATVIISSILNQVVFPIEVVATTKSVNDKLKKDGKNINILRDEKNKNIKKQSYLNSKLSDVIKEINNLRNGINTIRKNSDENQDEIFKLKDNIDKLKGEINNLDTQLKNLYENTETLTDSLLDAIKKTYIYGITNPVEEIAKAETFTDLINNFKYSEVISNETSKMVESYKAKINEIEAIKKLRQKEIQDITDSKIKFDKNCENNVKRAQDLESLLQKYYENYEKLTSLIDQNKKQTKEIDSAIKLQNEIKKDFKEKIETPAKEIEKTIKQDNKNKENEKNIQKQNEKTLQEKNLESSKEKTKNKSGFIFPVNGKTQISQNFKKHHSAVDIQTFGKPNPVVAAKDGKVVVASRNKNGYHGYGYVVEIDHGNGVHTLYAHLSVIKVKVGQTVKQGEQIGNVGNTGKVSGATGMHLHYEKRVGNKKVNPL